MKTWLKPVGAVLIAGTMLVGGTVLMGSSNLSNAVYADEVQKNVINVVGSGEISVKPDIAYLSIGVQTEAATAKEAQSANAAKIAKLNTLLKDTWKINAKDIQTGQFYVQPNYTYTEKEGQKVKGYTAQHTLQVSYRDLDKIGQLLDAASTAGANVINNIQFATENPDQFEEQVIQKAMANANMKASAIAKAANRQVGIVLTVTQSSSGPAVYNQNYVMKEMAMDTGGASTQIEAGEIKVNTTLSVTYEMK
ncbi:SIMPL domain-containing protein [Paenibacillus sp. FSL K6-2524]|uniref:SIMPL domain-containing protein n=1 Tax=Paenibacillus sp. FSL K6-2524 TaxID=2954516 RepID=UPI0030FC3D9D